MTTALTALAAAAAFTAGLGAPAQAADQAAVCSAVAVEHRSVWAEPGTGAGTVGSVIAGRTYDADCALVPGATYTACGGTTDRWARVNHAGDDWGYLPSTCLSWAS